jgi:hypothetical protein
MGFFEFFHFSESGMMHWVGKTKSEVLPAVLSSLEIALVH